MRDRVCLCILACADRRGCANHRGQFDLMHATNYSDCGAATVDTHYMRVGQAIGFTVPRVMYKRGKTDDAHQTIHTSAGEPDTHARTYTSRPRGRPKNTHKKINAAM
jgi:hypothetical protein